MITVIRMIFVIYLSIVFLSACSNKKCNCDINKNTLIQEKETLENIITLNSMDHGAFGVTYILKVCDREGNMIETIDLRGDDIVPKLDSIVKNSIYISYSYPNSTQKQKVFKIPFENIVLGDGLLNKNSLKFEYIFSGKYVN